MTWFRFYHYLIIHLFATLALAVLVLCMARSAEASQAIPIPEETVTLAEQLDLSPLDLQGALNTTGLDVREYLYQVGHLERPRPLIYWPWNSINNCEANGNWNTNTGNGFYGGLQFLPGTWRRNGGTGMPHQASIAEQIRVAENTARNEGYCSWPVCAVRAGVVRSCR